MHHFIVMTGCLQWHIWYYVFFCSDSWKWFVRHVRTSLAPNIKDRSCLLEIRIQQLTVLTYCTFGKQGGWEVIENEWDSFNCCAVAYKAEWCSGIRMIVTWTKTVEIWGLNTLCNVCEKACFFCVHIVYTPGLGGCTCESMLLDTSGFLCFPSLCLNVSAEMIFVQIVLSHFREAERWTVSPKKSEQPFFLCLTAM